MSLRSLRPLSCTPKNNLLVGINRREEEELLELGERLEEVRIVA